MQKIQKLIAFLLLLFSVGCCLWLYRAEPTTTIDPNDNAFQYALIDRTNTMWEYAARTCPKTIAHPICHLSILIDHWVPNWAQGYNLPYYYSHIPQIAIVGSYRILAPLIGTSVTLFQYYHTLIYLLLCLLPVSVFVAFRAMGCPWLTAGFGALFAPLISTDGLYGIDQTSFLWRGWGLSSQLFALIWLPLVVAFTIRFANYPRNKTYAGLSILFLVLTTSGHLGIGMMAFMAVAIICFTPIVTHLVSGTPGKAIVRMLGKTLLTTGAIVLPTLLLLSYWIVPVFLHNDFHNISFWDPVWKFDSFGAIDVVKKLVNGELFDFGRFPLFTFFLFFGIVAIVTDENDTHTRPLPWLFFFFLVLLFGRTTWGGLIDLVPGMKEFHQHRFIVGLHLAGLFLAPLGMVWVINTCTTFVSRVVGKRYHAWVFAGVCLAGVMGAYAILFPHIIDYATYNETLIEQANNNFTDAASDTRALFTTLYGLQQEHPGRIYALRGKEGNDFRIASTPYYMQLSTFGLPTVLWLPETWSMNSDTEQFFNEDNSTHYDMYNIAYVVAPPTKTPQPFWKLIKETPSWKLYSVSSMQAFYITTGTAPSVVYSDKESLVNLVHIWIQSDYPKQHIYPQLRMGKQTETELLPNFRMTDEVTYQTPEGKTHSLLGEIPVYKNPSALTTTNPTMRVDKETNDTDMRFLATVTVSAHCPTCVVILKQTYHPNWIATVNGKRVAPIIVFPFYTGLRLEEPGTYDIVFSYQPAPAKILLAMLGIASLFVGIYIIVFRLPRTP